MKPDEIKVGQLCIFKKSLLHLDKAEIVVALRADDSVWTSVSGEIPRSWQFLSASGKVLSINLEYLDLLPELED